MANSNHSATALLTEHFRYTPLTLLDEIINTVNELVFHAVNQLEKAFSTAPVELLGFEPDTSHEGLSEEQRIAAVEEARQNEVDLGIVQVESLLNATVDKDFDKFEIYTLRNILAIGHAQDADLVQWVCLDHYRHLKLDQGAKHITPEAVQLQRRKLHETNKLNAMLKEEEARNKAVIEQLESLLGRKDRTNSASQPSLDFMTTWRGRQAMSLEMRQAVEKLSQVRQQRSQLQQAATRVQRESGS